MLKLITQLVTLLTCPFYLACLANVSWCIRGIFIFFDTALDVDAGNCHKLFVLGNWAAAFFSLVLSCLAVCACASLEALVHRHDSGDGE